MNPAKFQISEEPPHGVEQIRLNFNSIRIHHMLLNEPGWISNQYRTTTWRWTNPAQFQLNKDSAYAVEQTRLNFKSVRNHHMVLNESDSISTQ